MRGAWFVFFCWFVPLSFGQGLNTELGYNDDYSQKAKGIVSFDDHSIFVKEQTFSASFFTRSSILKVDTLGNEIYEIPIQPQGAEVVIISETMPSENNGIYLLGYARPLCDVSGGCFWFIQKRDTNGFLEWERFWDDQVCFGVSMSGMTLTQGNELVVHHNDFVNSKIVTLDLSGNTIAELNVNQSGFIGTEKIAGFSAIAFKQFALFGYDANGSMTAQQTFSTFIADVVAWNDSLYVTTADSLFIFDNNLQELAAQSVQNYSQFRQLKVRNTDIRLVANNNNLLHFLRLNKSLNITENIQIPTGDSLEQVVDYSNAHLSIARNFPLSEHFGIQFQDYSLLSSVNATVNRTDIGISAIQITQATITPSPTFNAVFTIEISADVLLKNFGNDTLNSCRLNHYISPALACGLIYYGEEFSNLNLAPGDSTWITLGLIHTDDRSFPNDSLNQEVCIYTSYPNAVTDEITNNDRVCTTVTFGIADIIELQTAPKTLVKIVDLLGREVEDAVNQPLIYMYSDGSTEKVLRSAEF